VREGERSKGVITEEINTMTNRRSSEYRPTHTIDAAHDNKPKTSEFE